MSVLIWQAAEAMEWTSPITKLAICLASRLTADLAVSGYIIAMDDCGRLGTVPVLPESLSFLDNAIAANAMALRCLVAADLGDECHWLPELNSEVSLLVDAVKFVEVSRLLGAAPAGAV